MSFACNITIIIIVDVACFRACESKIFAPCAMACACEL